MKRINWGIVGAGDIVRKRIAPAMLESELCRLAAVSRSRSDLAAAFAAEFGIEHAHASVQALVDNPEVEAVYIASPVFLHAEHTIAAARAGKHVLVEKPMAMDARECDRMIAEAKSAGVKLGVAYYRRFYPVVQRIKELLSSGEIGKPVFAQINTFERFNPDADHPRHWFVEKAKSGGGPMMDFGCHRLEVLTNLFGRALDLRSLVAKVVYDRDVEDTASVLLRFESGTCASLTVTHAASESTDTLAIYGTSGSIHVDSLNSGRVRIMGGIGARSEAHPPSSNFHLPLIEDFAQAILDDRDPTVDGATGREIAELEDRIYGR